MKTTVVHLEGIESVLSTAGVEKKMCQHPGIQKVETNFMTGTATVYHDDSITMEKIKRCVTDCGYHCAGEAAPQNIVQPGDPPVEMAHAGHDVGAEANRKLSRLWRPRRPCGALVAYPCLPFLIVANPKMRKKRRAGSQMDGRVFKKPPRNFAYDLNAPINA